MALQSGLVAPPPQMVEAMTSTSSARAICRQSRRAKATPSNTAWVMSARVVSMRRPTKAPRAIASLRGYVDTFLTDLRYAHPETARAFSHAPEYPRVAREALAAMAATGARVIVRILLLPGHVGEACENVHHVAEVYGDAVTLSLMSQYTPMRTFSQHPELSRRVTADEYEELLDFADSLGIEDYFWQDGPAAEESFIPDFLSYEGVLVPAPASLDRTAVGSVAAEEILIAPGIKPSTDLLRLENTDVTVDSRGYIETNEFLETAAEGIWALGDINGLAPFRHKANYEAEVIAHNLFEGNTPDNWRWARYDVVPAVTYTYPEAAHVGMTEAAARKAGYDVDVVYNHYSAAVKGYALGFLKGHDDDGFVKLVIDKKTTYLLGAHIIGHEASILIQPFINLMNAGEQKLQIRHEEIASPAAKKLRAEGLTRNLVPQSIYTIGETMTPHPSLQEVTMWTRYYYEGK